MFYWAITGIWPVCLCSYLTGNRIIVKWCYPREGCGEARATLRPVGVTTTLEHDEGGIRRYIFVGSIHIGVKGETFVQIKGGYIFEGDIEIFLEHTPWLVFPLGVVACVVEILIGNVEGRNAGYKEELYGHRGQDRDRSKT